MLLLHRRDISGYGAALRRHPPAAQLQLEPVYTRTAHDQNEDASLVAGHRVDELCLHLDLRMGARARAILYAGLADEADPPDRPVDPRQRH
jgi:hypothetical protein